MFGSIFLLLQRGVRDFHQYLRSFDLVFFFFTKSSRYLMTDDIVLLERAQNYPVESLGIPCLEYYHSADESSFFKKKKNGIIT